MALADHLLLILLILLFLLLASQAAAAPWQARRADPLQANSFLAPYADLVHKLESNPRSPPRAKPQDEGRITTPEPSEVLGQIVEELRRGHGTYQEAVQSEAAAGRHSTSRPVSAQDTVAMRDTDMPALSQPGEDQHSRVYAFYPADSGTDKERSSSASSAQGTTSFICPKDVRRSCMIGTAATVISVPLALLLCFILYQRRKKHLSAAERTRWKGAAAPAPAMRCLWPCRGPFGALWQSSGFRISLGPRPGHERGCCLSLPPGREVGSLQPEVSPAASPFASTSGGADRRPEPEPQLCSQEPPLLCFEGGSDARHCCWPRTRRLSGSRVSCRLPAGLGGMGGFLVGDPPRPLPSAAERAFSGGWPQLRLGARDTLGSDVRKGQGVKRGYGGVSPAVRLGAARQPREE
ncbi:uncharacterized protein PRD47_013791 [Ara ararauna]